MTNEEWKQYLKEKEMVERSKTIQNVLRYRAYVAFMSGGCKAAIAKLNNDCKHSAIRSRLSQDSIGKIKRGIAAELLFYKRFERIISLTPTLDAGCAFDFVGVVSDSGIASGNGFIRIDATRSMFEKRKKETTTCRGQSQWPFRFAHIQKKSVTWYDEKAKQALKESPWPNCHGDDNGYSVPPPPEGAAFANARRLILEQIEFEHSLHCAIAEIAKIRYLDESLLKRLEAHAVFFASYKYALNIVPALSCGDLCDFIGEHNGELVRYRVLESTEGYFENERPVLAELSKSFKYMVALYDATTRSFEFYDWDHWKLFDDIPDLDEQHPLAQQTDK